MFFLCISHIAFTMETGPIDIDDDENIQNIDSDFPYFPYSPVNWDTVFTPLPTVQQKTDNPPEIKSHPIPMGASAIHKILNCVTDADPKEHLHAVIYCLYKQDQLEGQIGEIISEKTIQAFHEKIALVFNTQITPHQKSIQYIVYASNTLKREDDLGDLSKRYHDTLRLHSLVHGTLVELCVYPGNSTLSFLRIHDKGNSFFLKTFKQIEEERQIAEYRQREGERKSYSCNPS